MVQYIVCLESIIWFKRYSADKLFLVKIWHSKCWCDHENEVKVIKIYPLLSHVLMVFICEFGQNPPIGSGDKVLLVAKQWIHWFPGIYSHLDETRRYPYTLKRSVYWSSCSLNYCLVHSGEFHPNNLQYNSDHHFGYLSLRLETMHYTPYSSDLLWDPLNKRRPKLARNTKFINSVKIDNA